MADDRKVSLRQANLIMLVPHISRQHTICVRKRSCQCRYSLMQSFKPSLLATSLSACGSQRQYLWTGLRLECPTSLACSCRQNRPCSVDGVGQTCHLAVAPKSLLILSRTQVSELCGLLSYPCWVHCSTTSTGISEMSTQPGVSCPRRNMGKD